MPDLRKQTGKKLSQNTKCHSERLFCHPERSAAESKDLALEHNSTPATSSPRHCERSEAISLHHSLFLVRHSIFTTTFTFLLVLFLIAAPAYAKYGGGTGGLNDPYLIYTAEQMNEIGLSVNWDDWDKHFQLMADIDLSELTGTSFNIIGTDYDNAFTGVFDGSGHTISNFSYTSIGTSHIALFAYVSGENAEIKNLGLLDPNVDAGTGNYVGSLVGCLSYGTISNCYVEGGSVSGYSRVGGLVGDNRYGTINNCYTSADVSGYSRVGGLVGFNYRGTINNCYTSADVSGSVYVGGLVGLNYRGTINNCYTSADVSGSVYVGGLVGNHDYGTISNCYATGSVFGTDYTGGLAGHNDNGSYISSFWNREVNPDLTGVGNIADPYGVMGRTTLEMHTQSTFTSYGWDFVGETENGTEDFWYMPGCGYPALSWQPVGIVPEVTGLSEDQALSVITAAGPVVVIKTGHSEVVPEGYVISQEPSAGCEAAIVTIIVSDGFPYEAGSGTEADPYRIWTAEQMNAIGAYPGDWDKQFVLMSDIDLSAYTGTSFNIIGDIGNRFWGIFDGSGHTISNFTYTFTGRSSIGLFGYVSGENAEIKNLGLIDPNVDAGNGNYVGSLVGHLRSGTITNCYAEGGSVAGDHYVGGLVGFNSGTISNCYTSADVSGTGWSVGGLVGYNYQGTITNSCSTGNVAGDRKVGGLVGSNHEGTISNCYSTGSVAGSYDVGGLVGENGFCTRDAGCYPGTISNCYATGSVTGTSYIGGLVGFNSEGAITNCYATGSVSGDDRVGGLAGFGHGGVTFSFWDIETSGQLTSAGGTGLTTAEMQTASTFILWGCDAVWTIDEQNDYPRLWWENAPGELITKPSYCQGSGTEADPYLIYTAEQLNMIGLVPCSWDKHFLLCADIDLSGFTGTSFNIIGINYYNPFTGVFDGSGHTISNFSYISTGTSYIGIFGYLDDPNVEIKDLGLIAPDVDAGTGGVVGALVGYFDNGTITDCYVEGGSVTGYHYVGGLVGRNGRWETGGTINNCYTSADVSGNRYVVGGLVGWNRGTISNCYATGGVEGDYEVGGLVGRNWYGTVYNCYATGSISGDDDVGGLVGDNEFGTINNCYTSADVSGDERVGGLVGDNYQGTITDSYSSGSISGNDRVGGLMGENEGRIGIIANCYSTGSVSGNDNVGGLVGQNGRCYSWGCRPGTVSTCYSTGSVSGDDNVGGLVGWNWGTVTASFWDIETSGQSTSAGGMGKTTAGMQTESTFTDAGWDFETPVWTIDEGADYPRLWWEISPVLHAEPEVTLGTSNTITWDPVPGANDYYAECATDANFTSIIYNTGWITETSYKFTGLELGQRYWYSVKARNIAGVESQWSNVESSLQCSLSDAVEIMLDPNNLKSENLKKPYINKINIAQEMIDSGNFTAALSKLENDILPKTNGCAETGEPDKNDWIITCQEQEQIYPLIIETIENVKGLMNQ